MVYGINKLKSIFYGVIRKLYENEYGGKFVLNINRNFLNPQQKKILLCYSVEMFNLTFESTVFHANMFHSIQMIKVLINHGYSIDVCKAKNTFDLKRLKRNYDFIIGFGPLYESIIAEDIKGKKILLLTENDPVYVKEKYKLRVNYFIERHGRSLLRFNTRRDAFYTPRQIELSDICIAMTSDFNLARINKLMTTYKINVNGLSNDSFILENKCLQGVRHNFVWFGSAGAIHKGLDILVDVFAQLPNYSLSLYGLNKKEKPLIEKIASNNIKICGSIDVTTDNFIQDVVDKHAFVISASCSEGMNTGVATCMMHGLIPVMTKETGFDNPGCYVDFEDYSIEGIKAVILELEKISNERLAEMRDSVYKYARKTYSLENFTKEFDEIITSIENKYD